MIVTGYQGIGKSTLSKISNEYIDLESSNFWVDGNRANDWYKPYCNIANHLSEQGYIVFTSSHEVVRKYLIEKSNQQLVLVFPSIELKDKWIEKLTTRYNTTNSDKDFKALMNAKEMYAYNIDTLLNESDKFEKVVIRDINYNLESLLSSQKNVPVSEDKYNSTDKFLEELKESIVEMNLMIEGKIPKKTWEEVKLELFNHKQSKENAIE